MQNTPARVPVPRPSRSSRTKLSNAPAGWPETCVGHEFGWKSRIRESNVCSIRGMSETPRADGRYSSGRSSCTEIPRVHPSMSARLSVHAIATIQVTTTSGPQRSVRAAHGPTAMTSSPIATATAVL